MGLLPLTLTVTSMTNSGLRMQSMEVEAQIGSTGMKVFWMLTLARESYVVAFLLQLAVASQRMTQSLSKFSDRTIKAIGSCYST